MTDTDRPDENGAVVVVDAVGDANPPATVDGIAAELDDIRAARRENSHAYRRDKGMQARELELIAAQQGSAPAGDLDPELVASWEQWGGVEVNAGRARAVADAVLAEVALRNDAVAGFDALPATAQRAVLEEIALEPDRRARPVSDDDLIGFVATDAGEAIYSEFGDGATRHMLGVVRQRLGRVMAGLSAADRAALEDYAGALPPAAQAVLVRALAGAA